jgi:YfiH family protein
MTEQSHAPAPEVPLFLKSSLLEDAGFAHAFFTRMGGFSSGVFDSLNFTTISGDSEENVANNLAVAARALAVDPAHIYFLSQVHGTAFEVVTGKEDTREVQKKEGDVVLTRVPGVAAAIRTADCVSVLLASPETGWVAACHAGWQGCVLKVVPATLQALKAQGAGQLIAAIGPHISRASFEVSEDVAQELINASPDKDIVDRSYEKPHIDLRKMVRAQLEEGGISSDSIDDVLGCTVIEKERYFSFRRDGNPSGRMLSAIVGRGK